MEVVNWLAPEHLEIVTDDPDALLAAGAQRRRGLPRARTRPTALGDYAAGANHVLPTGRSARFAERAAGRRLPQARPRRPREPEGVGRAESCRRGDRPRRGPRRARALARPASRTCEPPASAIAPREDLRALEGYHSPQLDVSVRLNTNESPFPPPSGLRRRLARRRSATVPLHRYPDRGARALRSAIGESLGQPPARVFCANGSNEVLQTLLLTYGGPGRRGARLRAHVRAARHIARITGTEVVVGARAATTSPSIPTRPARSSSEHQPEIVFLCSPNNPTGTVEPRAHGRGDPRRRARPRGRGRGVRRVRPRVRARPGRRRARRSS